MASEIRASLEELKSIAQELHNINKKTKELRLRKKELENKVLEYLDSNGKPGLKLDNIVFMTSEKRASARKKKSEVVRDSVDVLRKHGLEDNVAQEILLELEQSRKGVASSVPVLKMKTAPIFS